MDVLPKLLTEIRDDDAVAAIVGTRVRGFEPAPPVRHPDTGAVLEKGDARQGTTQDPYVAFVVLVQLDAPREKRMPVQRAVIAARCYGRTPAEAASLRWAVSKAVHPSTGPRGVRVHANGLGIYQSFDEAGGEQEKDPNTEQPYQTVVIASLATTQAVA